MRLFPVQQIAGTADLGNLVPDFLDLQRIHIAFVIAQLLFQALDFGVFAIGRFKVDIARPCGNDRFFFKAAITRRGNRCRIRRIGVLGQSNIHILRCAVATHGAHQPALDLERLDVRLVADVVAIRNRIDGTVVHQHVLLAASRGSLLFNAIRGFLLAEQSGKPLRRLHEEREMPGPKPERKDQNERQNSKQDNEGRYDRHRPEHRDEYILHKELPENATVREKRFAG